MSFHRVPGRSTAAQSAGGAQTIPATWLELTTSWLPSGSVAVKTRWGPRRRIFDGRAAGGLQHRAGRVDVVDHQIELPGTGLALSRWRGGSRLGAREWRCREGGRPCAGRWMRRSRPGRRPPRPSARCGRWRSVVARRQGIRRLHCGPVGFVNVGRAWLSRWVGAQRLRSAAAPEGNLKLMGPAFRGVERCSVDDAWPPMNSRPLWK